MVTVRGSRYRQSLRVLLRKVLPAPVALYLREVWIARQVVAGRAHLETDIAVLDRFVSASDVCWDIGANSGTYTLALARLAQEVIAFEPVPHNERILRRVKDLARLNNVQIQTSALSDRAGSARMSVPTEGFYGGYYMAALDDEGGLIVRSASVDGLLAEGLKEPDFIKCDAEGAEARIVNGARGLIARRPPIWLMETFEDDLFDLMHSLGYTAYLCTRSREIVPAPRRLASDRNYWFVPTRGARTTLRP
jgi:FkbM family methyltransferase